MLKNSRLLVYLVCLFAMIFWSLSFIWYPEAYQFYTPFVTVFFRLIISSFILFTLGLTFRWIEKIKPGDFKRFAFLALFEPLLYFIGESQGMQFVSPTAASVIISIIPLLVPVLAFIILKEKLLVKNILGIIISCAGVIMVVLNNQFEFTVSVKGILLLLISVFAATFYSIYLKKLADDYNPVTIIAWQNTIGIIYFIPLVLIFEPSELFHSKFTALSIIPLLKLAVFASTLAFLFYSYSVKKLGAVKANIFTNLIPVITAFLSFLMLNEKLLTHNIIGIGVVVGGLILSQLNPIQMVKKVPISKLVKK